MDSKTPPSRSSWLNQTCSSAFAAALFIGCLLTVLTPGTAQATYLELSNLWLVTRLPQETVARPVSRVSSAEYPVVVHLVLEGRAAGQLPVYFTDAPGLDLGRGPIPTSQLRPWDKRMDGEISIRWTQLEPEAKTYDNLKPSFHLEQLAYQEVELPQVEGQWTWKASVHPTLLPDPAPQAPLGVGIMRFKVRVKHQDYKLESPGAAGAYAGGIGEEVLSVAYRGPDADPLVSWAQSRFNTPYVAGASKRGGGEESHQALLALGVDGVELLPAAWRMAGHPEASFVGNFLLDPEHEARSTIQVARVRPEGDGYVDAMGELVSVGMKGIRPGDLLRSGNEAGIFARDVEPLGVLDANDMVVTALFQEPRVQPLKDSLHGPMTILRWNGIRQVQLELKQLGFFKGPVDGRSSSELVTSLARFREKYGLEALSAESLAQQLQGMDRIGGVMPAHARLEALRRGSDPTKMEAAQRQAAMQRILDDAGWQVGAAGEAAMKLLPPRPLLPEEALVRSLHNPFKPGELDFWDQADGLERTAQVLPIADVNRDGKLDATDKPVEIQAAGAAYVLWTEQDWKGRRADATASRFGNQVWLYIPRLSLILGYLHLDEVKVKAGQTVSPGAVLGTLGRTGKLAQPRRVQTALRVAAFSTEQGRMSPLDVVSLWSSVVPAHPLPRLTFVEPTGVSSRVPSLVE